MQVLPHANGGLAPEHAADDDPHDRSFAGHYTIERADADDTTIRRDSSDMD
jgi:hypothetical protein